MAIDASGFKVGNNGQVLIGPDGTNYWGTFSNPTENDPNGSSAWGYQGLAPGTTQFMPGPNGWSTDPSAQFYSSSDFTNVPDSLKSFFSQPGTTIQGFKSAPVGVQVTQAPDEGFMGSFKYFAPFALGAMAPFVFGGAAAGSAAGGAMDMGVGGVGQAMGLGSGGLADIAWGVNPQGGNMDWWDAFTNAVGDNYGTGGVTGSMDAVAPFNGFETGLRDLSQLANPTNLQDMITKLDAAPGGTAKLNQILEAAGYPGGSSDAAGSLLNRLQSYVTSNPTNALKLLGQLGAAGLGAFASNQQANALQGLANKYSDMGAPYRALLASSYADPAGYLANDPAIQASVNQGTNALARALSVKGNPAQSGTALTDIQNYATQNLYGQLGNERNRLANFGGLSGFNAAAPTLDAQAVGQQGNMYNALGYGLQQVTNPQPSLTDIVKAMNLQGLA